MNPADLGEVARLHERAFPNFFLTSLGAEVLAEIYRGMIEEGSGIALVAESEGRVVGLAAGSAAPVGFYRRLLLRRWWKFCLLLAPRLFVKPHLVWRLSWRVREAGSALQAGDASLLSLAVLPSGQHRGTGSMLLREFLASARSRGAKRVALTTDADDNVRVTAFYERMGFEARSTILTREKRRLHEYVRDL